MHHAKEYHEIFIDTANVEEIKAALAGTHIATIPYKVIWQMIKHPLTDSGIEKFNADWAFLNK